MNRQRFTWLLTMIFLTPDDTAENSQRWCAAWDELHEWFDGLTDSQVEETVRP